MAPFYVLAGMRAAWRLARRREFDIVTCTGPCACVFGWAARRGAEGEPGSSHVVRHRAALVKVGLPWLRRFSNGPGTSDEVVAISSYTGARLRARPRSSARHSLRFGSRIVGRVRPLHDATTTCIRHLYVGNLIPRKAPLSDRCLSPAGRNHPGTTVISVRVRSPEARAQVRHSASSRVECRPCPGGRFAWRIAGGGRSRVPVYRRSARRHRRARRGAARALSYRVPVIGSAVGASPTSSLMAKRSLVRRKTPRNRQGDRAHRDRSAFAKRLAETGSRRVRSGLDGRDYRGVAGMLSAGSGSVLERERVHHGPRGIASAGRREDPRTRTPRPRDAPVDQSPERRQKRLPRE